jgi:hypothetical protein
MTAGAFRRAILIRATAGEVVADLEDDFHRFGVTLAHDGRRLAGLHPRAGRFPWATCAEAPRALEILAGAPVSAHPADLFRHADPRLHCTHLFELTALALAQAARGDGARLFEAEVTDSDRAGQRTARLFVDGSPVLTWRLEGETITDPPAFAGRTPSSFNSRALSEAEPDLAERLLVLRRAAQTALGRGVDVDAFPTAAAMDRPPACYSLQLANASRARRMTGSVRDWPDRTTLRASLTNDA